MRFVLMIAGAAATGALSAGAIGAIFPQTTQTFAAVRALGGDLTNFRIDISAINPVKAYQEVMQKVTSGDPGAGLGLPKGPAFKITPFNPDALRPAFKIDERAMQRAVAAGINSRIQQDYRRSQDLIAYGRNPMAWHGPPPH